MDTALHDLFLEELRDIYDAEHQLAKTLVKLAKAARAEELKAAFESHAEETKGHIERLESVFESLDEKAKREKCEGIQGLLKEGDELLAKLKGSPALDAGLIAAAQKCEHYEIASYGCLCTWAELMGHDEALDLLKENLAEEKEADEKLTEIAEAVANLEGQEEEA